MVLRKKYPIDKEFSTLLQLTGEMDAQMVEIDNLLCRVYFQTLPHKSTLIRWSNQIREETLNKFNQRLTQIATQQKITKGIKPAYDKLNK